MLKIYGLSLAVLAMFAAILYAVTGLLDMHNNLALLGAVVLLIASAPFFFKVIGDLYDLVSAKIRASNGTN
jgi:hypothetical protein